MSSKIEQMREQEREARLENAQRIESAVSSAYEILNWDDIHQGNPITARRVARIFMRQLMNRGVNLRGVVSAQGTQVYETVADHMADMMERFVRESESLQDIPAATQEPTMGGVR